MLIQTKEAHYARGSLHIPGNTNRIFAQHITVFWAAPVFEGPAVVQGHRIDADEEVDPHDSMDLSGMHEPEAIRGRLAAQKGEFYSMDDVLSESPCARCTNSECPVGFDDESHCSVGLGGTEFLE